jgi:hypothetical protein
MDLVSHKMEDYSDPAVRVTHYLPSGNYQLAMVPYIKVINHFLYTIPSD